MRYKTGKTPKLPPINDTWVMEEGPIKVTGLLFDGKKPRVIEGKNET